MNQNDPIRRVSVISTVQAPTLATA
jgi:hypothetical protein